METVRREIVDEIAATREENRQLREAIEQKNQDDEEWRKRVDERDRLLMKTLRAMQKKKRWWQRGK